MDLLLGVVLAHLPGEILRANLSQFQLFLVNFSRCSLILLEALVSFHQISVNFSQFQGNPESKEIKNLLMPLFLLGCFPGQFQEGKRPIKAFGKRPIKVRKRPIKANALFSGTPPWWKTAPLKFLPGSPLSYHCKVCEVSVLLTLQKHRRN